MSKKHIIEIGYQKYAADSITAATQAVNILSKLKPVRLNTDSRDSDDWFYEPDEDDRFGRAIELKLNQRYREPRKPKAKKPLALPKPKRGTILCICEKSSVSPGETCAHCGLSFSVSHNRTHDRESNPNLRLL